MTSDVAIYSMWLRDTYARIEKHPIFEFDTELMSNSVITFISGKDIPRYISKYETSCGDIITLLIPGLQRIYWENITLLKKEEADVLHAEKENITKPKFIGVYEGKNVPEDIIPEYNLVSKIGHYDSIYVSVAYFVESFNNKIPIEILLDGTNVHIQLHYRKYDSWDPENERVIENILCL